MRKYRIRDNSIADWCITIGVMALIMALAGAGNYFIDGIY